ncbi:gamma-glutamyl-gamma-aminobutyrate hydrolase [Planotetraspora thailandica]|uniref:Gamma-glutamyl-gamma-aminobutyrate hydrolase n=1 Tax=Planotetraspora thailandica TaxID=487172 RepID=A0A8J3XZK1_9ACTN|nr:gamma-glutamyl-gamma-aminobutyrate hydrolase family protein [Planotetraspora thailandica]GII58045.1 gamma-glutamyl-gamma-aminobutyrate hydrolase [Planotetraspora thailandica]
MARPLVGITTYLEAARWSVWVREAAVSPQAYAVAVEKAGGSPVLLPPTSAASVPEYVRGLDGIVLAGGVEISPTLYGEAPGERYDERFGEPQAHRDRFDLALARAAVESDLPVLGVSRGMHVLNVSQGGTLIPWLPEVVAHDRHETARHQITVSISSKVGKAVGDHAEVTGAHRQGLRRLGTGVQAVAWADDQIVEAIEMPGRRFAVGVQWHPERGTDISLYEALVEAARP